MSRRILLAGGAIVVAAGLVLLLMQLDSGPSASAAPGEGTAAAGATSRPVLAGDEPPADLRGEADVDRYLAGIEAAAREQGLADSAAIRRGHAAIRGLEPTLGAAGVRRKGREFGMRMDRLQREIELAPTHRELDRLATAIAGTQDPRERDRLRSQYVTTARTLPQAYRLSAMARLEQPSGH